LKNFHEEGGMSDANQNVFTKCQKKNARRISDSGGKGKAGCREGRNVFVAVER